MSNQKRRLPAEWEPQSGVMLAWPHGASDWAEMLGHVQPVVIEMVRHIARFERVLLLVDAVAPVRDSLAAAGVDMAQVQLVEIETNDTWTRDYGPLTVVEDGDFHLLDFGFNGWGLKFASDQDNQASRRLHAAGIFGKLPLQTFGLIFEGGSVESDGAGTLLTTGDCLLSPNRNPQLTQAAIEAELKRAFGAEQVLWLGSGHLAGDDTDSHIDILARFAPENTIVHMHCDDPADPHFDAFAAMHEELAGFTNVSGEPYRLVALPWPKAKQNRFGDLVAPSYANFLIINGAVLVPVYGDARDDEALAVIAGCFPGREVIGIQCSPLIEQGGSLHCMTMQFPEGVLR